MPLLLAVTGCALVVLALFDALWTTIAPHGAGPLAKRIARGWWAASLWVHRRRAGGAHGLLAVAGPALLVVAFLVWVGLLWAGWTLLFSTEPSAVVGSSSNEPADLAGRVYYIGFVLFTLGTGDYVPVGGAWEVLSAVASLSGLFLVTLAITYTLSVVSAVTAKRQLAGSIHSLGSTPPDVVRGAWGGSGFPGLDQHLPSLSQAIEMHTQRHLAYPIVHYFHTGDRRIALAPAVAVLSEALLLLDEAVAPEARPAPAVLHPARRTVASLLDTLGDAFIAPSDEAPPAPDIATVADAGIPTMPVGLFDQCVQDAAPRRRLLLGFMHDAGWTWEDVAAPTSS